MLKPYYHQLTPGLPDGYLKTRNPNLGIYWWALEWKMLVYFKAIWYNLWPFGTVCGHFGICTFPVLVDHLVDTM
jgi:hypothetical protein